MKKLIILVFLTACILHAQDKNKGNISLNFNGEKMNLPINSVTIRKENHIIVSAKASYKDSVKYQDVEFTIGLKELSSEDNPELLDGTSFNIAVKNIDESSGKDLSINFSSNNKEAAYFRNYKHGEQITWEVNSVSMRIKVSDIVFIAGNLIITGEFSGTFRSTLAKDKEISEIKDGKFKIII